MCSYAGLPARTTALACRCLLSSRSRVRILPGALTSRFTSKNAGESAVSADVAAFSNCSPARRPHPPRSRWIACANLGVEPLALIATALREQITGDRRAPRAAAKMLEPREVVVVISTGWVSCAGRRPASSDATPDMNLAVLHTTFTRTGPCQYEHVDRWADDQLDLELPH